MMKCLLATKQNFAIYVFIASIHFCNSSIFDGRIEWASQFIAGTVLTGT